MYSITEENNTLKIVIRKKYTRVFGLALILFCLFFGSWPVHYQLKCALKSSGYAGQCALVSKVLYIIPLSTPLGQILDADLKRSSRRGGFATDYQIVLELDSERSQYLPFYFNNHENASIEAAYINQFIGGGIQPTYDIEDPESNVFTQMLTILVLLFGLNSLFMRNGTILFDKNQGLLFIQPSSITTSTKQYSLDDVNKAVVEEKMSELMSEVEKRYILVLELKEHHVLLLSDTVNEVKSELMSMSEQINKFLQLS
jgi:hypothetical protein